MYSPLKSEETITLEHYKSHDHKIKWQHLNEAGLTEYWIFLVWDTKILDMCLLRISSLMESDICKLPISQ